MKWILPSPVIQVTNALNSIIHKAYTKNCTNQPFLRCHLLNRLSELAAFVSNFSSTLKGGVWRNTTILKNIIHQYSLQFVCSSCGFIFRVRIDWKCISAPGDLICGNDNAAVRWNAFFNQIIIKYMKIFSCTFSAVKTCFFLHVGTRKPSRFELIHSRAHLEKIDKRFQVRLSSTKWALTRATAGHASWSSEERHIQARQPSSVYLS